MQHAAIGAAPLFLCVISSFHVYRSGIPVLFLARYVRPALDQEDALAARRKFPGEGTAACAAADDDEIVLDIIHTPIRRHECRILTRSFCVRSPGANRRIRMQPSFQMNVPTATQFGPLFIPVVLGTARQGRMSEHTAFVFGKMS